jgi:hypothetical protein
MLTNKAGRDANRQVNHPDPRSRRQSAQDHNIVPQTAPFEYRTPDPFRVAELLGIDIYYKPMPHCVKGIAVSTDHHDGTPWKFILLNSRNGRCCMTFTLWHEIKHALCHFGEISARSTGPRFHSDPQEEADADAFARSMTMPEGAVRRAVDCGYTVRKMALAFGVTQPQMKARLLELGVNVDA